MYKNLPEFEQCFKNLQENDPDNSEKYQGVEGGMHFLELYEQSRKDTQGAVDVVISPQVIRKKLSPQMRKMIQIPLMTYETAKDIYALLPGIEETYNTKYGQIWCLEERGIHGINLGNFWSVLPNSFRKKMNQWQKINFPLDSAYSILIEFAALYQDGNVEDTHFDARKLADFVQKYNKVDGQIDWLRDQKLTTVNLGNFWSLIPKSLQEKMTEWQQINLPFEDAEKICSQLLSIDNERYNHPYGYVHWLYDMGIQVLNPLQTVNILTQGKNQHWKFPYQFTRLQDLVESIEDQDYFKKYPLERFAKAEKL